MDELRKREAAARGEEPAPGARRDRDSDPDPDAADDDTDRDDLEADADADADATDLDTDADDDDADETDTYSRPRSLDDQRGGGGKPPRRPPGGPDDGGPGRAARTGRRLGLYALVIVVIAVFLLFSVGIDLWTDALWFQSVGFDSVFWTRVVATLGLGVAAFLVAAVVLLGNLWLAGRLAPPPSAEGAGSLRSLVDRINEAAQAADDRRNPNRQGYRRRARPVREQPGDHLRSRRHAGSHAARRLGPRRHRAVHRPAHRRDRVGGLGDGPSLPEPRPVLADGERHRPDLRPRHRLLPVRAAVPAARPGPVQRHRPDGARPDPRSLHRRRIAERPRLLDADPGPPRRPRRAVPAVGGVRLPARQARARLQHPRRRDRRQLHRPERPVPRLRRADLRVRDRRRAARRRRRSRG